LLSYRILTRLCNTPTNIDQDGYTITPLLYGVAVVGKHIELVAATKMSRTLAAALNQGIFGQFGTIINNQQEQAIRLRTRVRCMSSSSNLELIKLVISIGKSFFTNADTIQLVTSVRTAFSIFKKLLDNQQNNQAGTIRLCKSTKNKENIPPSSIMKTLNPHITANNYNSVLLHLCHQVCIYNGVEIEFYPTKLEQLQKFDNDLLPMAQLNAHIEREWYERTAVQAENVDGNSLSNDELLLTTSLQSENAHNGGIKFGYARSMDELSQMAQQARYFSNIVYRLHSGENSTTFPNLRLFKSKVIKKGKSIIEHVKIIGPPLEFCYMGTNRHTVTEFVAKTSVKPNKHMNEFYNLHILKGTEGFQKCMHFQTREYV